MKSILFEALFVLFAVVTILGIAPAFAQYDTPDQSTGSVVGKVIAYTAKASDGTTVIVRTSHPISGQVLSLGIAFFDTNQNSIHHQNYAITVTQDNAVVLSNPTGHTHTGIDTQTTSALTSGDPVNIQITLNGVGLPTADPSTWTGVKGEVLSFGQTSPNTTMMPMSNMTTTTGQNEPGNQTGIPLGAPYTAGNNATVPEFGPVAIIVLAIAVLSMVVFAAKTRIIPRL